MTSKLFLFALVSLFCFQAFAGSLYTLINDRYLSFARDIKRAESSDQKINFLKSAVDTYGFNCTQAWGLLESFTTNGDKLKGLNIIKNNIVDPNNKTTEIIEKFNRTDDRVFATNILASITAAQTIPHPNDALLATHKALLTNRWTDQEIHDLLIVMQKMPNSVGKIKVAEISIMSRTELLIPEQVMMLFNALNTLKDIFTLKSIIDDRIVGITCDQLVTLIKRFSIENQKDSIINQCISVDSCPLSNELSSLADFIQGGLSGKSCENLSQILGNVFLEETSFALLEAFSTSILDIENKMTILDAFLNKEKAKKILNTFKARSILFGAPTSKNYLFLLNDGATMYQTFNYISGQNQKRIDLMRTEFNKIANSLDQNTSVYVFNYHDSIYRCASETAPLKGTDENIKSMISCISGDRSLTYKYNAYDTLKVGMNLYNIDTIYIVSGGQAPNVGVKTDVSGIIADVKQWNSQKNIKINTIGLFMGNYSNDDKQRQRSLLKGLADVTGGTYRIFDQ